MEPWPVIFFHYAQSHFITIYASVTFTQVNHWHNLCHKVSLDENISSQNVSIQGKVWEGQPI
jgi:hypothetical protein